MRRILALSLVVVAAFAIAASAFASQSPKALRSSIASAFASEHWLHYVSTGGATGLQQRMVSDIAGDRGIQHVTVHVQGHTGRFTVIVMHHLAYLRGDRDALRYYLGFPASYAGRWISIPPRSRAYAPIAADVTLGSFRDDHVPHRELSVVRGEVDGVRAVGLRGTSVVLGSSLRTTIYAKSNGLPLEATDVSTQNGVRFTSRETLGPWNRAVHIVAPKHAVPISSIGRGGTSD